VPFFSPSAKVGHAFPFLFLVGRFSLTPLLPGRKDVCFLLSPFRVANPQSRVVPTPSVMVESPPPPRRKEVEHIPFPFFPFFAGKASDVSAFFATAVLSFLTSKGENLPSFSPRSAEGIHPPPPSFFTEVARLPFPFVVRKSILSLL